ASQALAVPAPSVLGLWVGLWSLIPVLGLVIGYLPIIGLAAAENQERAVVAVVVLFLWMVLAALARRRWIACHSVDVSRLLLTLSVMTGLHVGRISGAVVGVFLAAAVGAALAEARRLNVTGELGRSLDQLFAVPPPPPSSGDRTVRHVAVDIAPRSVVFALLVIVTLVLTYWMLTSIPAVLI